MIELDWKPRLHAYLGGIVKNLDGVPLAIGGIHDHVHLLVGLKTSHRLDYVLRDIKADSSKWINRELGKKFAWQKGYGAFTVSPTGVEAVRKYVQNQEEHHIGKTFKQEYIELLERSDTPYNERYLW